MLKGLGVRKLRRLDGEDLPRRVGGGQRDGGGRTPADGAASCPIARAHDVLVRRKAKERLELWKQMASTNVLFAGYSSLSPSFHIYTQTCTYIALDFESCYILDCDFTFVPFELAVSARHSSLTTPSTRRLHVSRKRVWRAV